uniref:Putative LOV domain-containing protein n=1 Tax=Tetraselmis chuii TaxID=63592 RepID=A0A126WY00_9CHLO|nr:putative LOV domain-containing protein [Tetraselmis chuii]
MKADIRQANLLNTMLDTQSTAVVITDARQDDQPIVYANPIFELVSGYSQEEVLGKNCRFLQAPPGKPRVPSFTSMSLKRKIQNGVPMNVRLLNYHKNGTPMWNDLSLVPLRNESGEVTHFVGLQTVQSAPQILPLVLPGRRCVRALAGRSTRRLPSLAPRYAELGSASIGPAAATL